MNYRLTISKAIKQNSSLEDTLRIDVGNVEENVLKILIQSNHFKNSSDSIQNKFIKELKNGFSKLHKIEKKTYPVSFPMGQWFISPFEGFLLKTAIDYTSSSFTDHDDFIVVRAPISGRTRGLPSRDKEHINSRKKLVSLIYKDIKTSCYSDSFSRVIKYYCEYYLSTTNCVDIEWYKAFGKYRSLGIIDVISKCFFMDHVYYDLINKTDFSAISKETVKILSWDRKKIKLKEMSSTGFTLCCNIAYIRLTFIDLKTKRAFCDLLLSLDSPNINRKLYEIAPDALSSTAIVDLFNFYIRINDIASANELLIYLKKIERSHKEIAKLDGILERLKRIEKLKSTKNIEFNSLNSLSGEEFEKLLEGRFEELGFSTRSTPNTGDYGADIIIETSSGTRVSIQSKRFKNKVNLKAIQEVVASLPHYSCDIGIVITNNGYLNSAIKLAESNDIELWDADSLLKFFDGDLSFSILREV